MIIDTLPKKFSLAVLISFGSVVWLYTWHEYGFSRTPLLFPPFSNESRDALIILIPVMLGVWISVQLTKWIVELTGRRMSTSNQAILAALITTSLITTLVMSIEGTRTIRTGFGNEFIFISSICGRLYPNGNWLLSLLRAIFPGLLALRLHILLQDGFNLALVNLAIIILSTLLMEGIGKVSKSNLRPVA